MTWDKDFLSVAKNSIQIMKHVFLLLFEENMLGGPTTYVFFEK